MSTRTTRLAPSPTGAMHLGNAFSFLITWVLGRQNGCRVIMRIEDLDGPRVKQGADQLAIDDLRWLGLDWDGEVIYQRNDLSVYRDALLKLRGDGLIYPCGCTRGDIRSALSAPHSDGHELRYPGTCRPPPPPPLPLPPLPPPLPELPPGKNPGELLGELPVEVPGAGAGVGAGWRLIVPDEPIEFEDMLCGSRVVNVQQEVGDFLVSTKEGVPAYQLAVVVDDARQGVTDVIRGDDLLASTARQLWVYHYLGLGPRPRYLHVPLVLGPDGRRLAKRHGDTRLRWYRDRGVSPDRVVGLLAWWCGILERPREIDTETLLGRLAVEKLPREPITFSPEDHEWLLS